MRNSNNKIQRICYIAVFTAVICVVSQLPGIPLPGGVPMTLQTLIIPLAGIVLGTVDGLIATLLYVLLGMIGLPVFSGFSGGLGVILGATGGFIISFPLMPLFAGLGEKLGSKTDSKSLYFVSLYCGLTIGAVLNYVVGTLWFAGIYLGAINGENILAGFTACVLPFIPTAIIKIVLCGVVGVAIKKSLRRAGLLAWA